MSPALDTTLADRELIRRAREGPEAGERRRAASLLLERYQDRVYLWCFRMVREHEQALDVAQEVLVSAYRKLGSFEGRSEFSSWLFVIARNRCLSALRRPSIFEEDGAAPEAVDPAVLPDRRLEEDLDEEAFLDLVRGHLDPLEREALWLRCFERVPIEELTPMLRLESASGARGLLQRARRKLRAAMAEQGMARR